MDSFEDCRDTMRLRGLNSGVPSTVVFPDKLIRRVEPICKQVLGRLRAVAGYSSDVAQYRHTRCTSRSSAIDLGSQITPDRKCGKLRLINTAAGQHLFDVVAGDVCVGEGKAAMRGQQVGQFRAWVEHICLITELKIRRQLAEKVPWSSMALLFGETAPF
jgi:hypothetical protein